MPSAGKVLSWSLSLSLTLAFSVASAFELPSKFPFPWGSGFFHLQVGQTPLIHRAYRDTRVLPDQKFPIASLSKQMTAYLVYKLIDRGLLKEDSKISDLVPGLSAAPTTIQDLLEHRGGIDDYEGLISNTESYGNFNCEDLSQFKDLKTNEDLFYSNKGYCLVAKALEQITGTSFSRLMREEVFAPLGMNSSVSAEISDRFPDLKGFWPMDKDWNRLVAAQPQNFFGSAGVISTPNDLKKWQKAYKDPRFLPASLLAQIKAELSQEKAPASVYRRGLFFRLARDTQQLEMFHTGKIEAHTSYMTYHPESELFAFVLIDALLESEIQHDGDHFITQLKTVLPK